MFLISLNYPCPSLFRVLFAYVVFLVVSVVVRDLCTSGCRQDFANFYLSPPPFFLFCFVLFCFFVPFHNSLFNTSDLKLVLVKNFIIMCLIKTL